MLDAVGSSLINFRFEPTTPNMSQDIATRTVANRSQDVAANNIEISCVGILRSFGRGFRLGGFLYIFSFCNLAFNIAYGFKSFLS